MRPKGCPTHHTSAANSMTESSVHPFSALVARLRPRVAYVSIAAAILSSGLLSACASTPWYDTPPFMPVNVSPTEGTIITPKIPVVFTWDESFQAETYDFHIFNAETRAIDQYMQTGLKPSEICSAGSCRISLKLSLPDSNRHAWRVRASNIAGQSAWTRSIFTFSSVSAQ